MGLEFMPIFEEWAVVYDDEVNGGNPEYQEVFANYWQILDEINAASGEVVITSRCWQDRLSSRAITGNAKYRSGKTSVTRDHLFRWRYGKIPCTQ